MPATADDDMHIVEEEVDRRLIQIGDPRIADRGEDAAEVRVAREEGGLDERRVRDRIADPAAFVDIRTAFDLHRDELGRALAVADDRLRELLGHFDDRTAQRLTVGRCEVGDARVRRQAGRDQHQRVVGRRIAVDRDAVEREIGGLLQQALQQRGLDRRIGGDEAEHGRHVWADHPGAFGNAGDVDGGTADHEPPRRRLRHRIGRHDRLGGQRPVVFAQIGDGGRQPGDDAIDGQRLHDDAGGERQDLLGLDAELLRKRAATFARAR